MPKKTVRDEAEIKHNFNYLERAGNIYLMSSLIKLSQIILVAVTRLINCRYDTAHLTLGVYGTPKYRAAVIRSN